MPKETKSVLGKLSTSTGVAIGVLGVAFSPAVMDKLDSQQVFKMMLTALVLTALGESIIPAIKSLLPQRDQNNSKES